MPPTSDRLLADKTLERLRAVSVATVTMQLLKRGLRHTFIQGPRPLEPAARTICGGGLHVAHHTHA